MQKILGELKQYQDAFDAEELKAAERFFEWAMSYERKGLKVAADALRDEGRKAFEQYLSRCARSA